MKVLVDTHTFIWCTTDDVRLSPRAHDVIEDNENIVLLSAASAWEIIIKTQSGKLKLAEHPGQFIREQLFLTGMEPLSVTLTHTLQVLALPLHHKDPFDRILVAQSLVENLPILTSDPIIARYGVEIIW